MENRAQRSQDGSDTDADHAYRANLAMWPTHMHPLREIFDAPDMVLAVDMSNDPRVALIGGISPRKGSTADSRG